MQELFDAALMPVNLPFTILLGLVLLYWLTVMIGALDMDFLDFDLDVDADADIDVDVDADVDADSGDIDGGSVSWLNTILQFLNLGDVPFMIYISFVSIFLWAGSIELNRFFGNTSIIFAGMMFIPLLIGSLLLTKTITQPFKKFFRSLNKDVDAPDPVVGSICTITSTASTDRLGQAEVEIKGAPLLLNVKTWKGETLERGKKALVIEENVEENFYLIEEFQELG